MSDFIVKRRPKKEYEQFTCRIEVELLEKVKRTVLDYNLKSINELINMCIEYSLENMKLVEDETKEK